jgi:hypothetical protein
MSKTKPKTFDCVEAKRKAQQKLLGEFESRRDEFDSLDAFLEAKAAESEWASAVLAQFAKPSREGRL